MRKPTEREIDKMRHHPFETAVVLAIEMSMLPIHLGIMIMERVTIQIKSIWNRNRRKT